MSMKQRLKKLEETRGIDGAKVNILIQMRQETRDIQKACDAQEARDAQVARLDELEAVGKDSASSTTPLRKIA